MVDHPHYDEIIDPVTYNKTIAQHLYIPESDRDLQEMLAGHLSGMSHAEVLEAGCGPGRITGMIGEIPSVTLTAIDISPRFLEHAQTIDSIKNNTRISLREADFETYRHPVLLDAVCTQGVHHHIEKGEKSQKYLANIHSQLKTSGAYFLGDEFLPDYTDAQERLVRAVIWYAHIIANALGSGYGKLALEEAKILLDDLNEGAADQSEKTIEQIKLVMQSVESINAYSESGNTAQSEILAQEFLSALKPLQKNISDKHSDLAQSRGDFKICERVLREEMNVAGFEIGEKRVQGPIERIGAMVVYTLKPIFRK